MKIETWEDLIESNLGDSCTAIKVMQTISKKTREMTGWSDADDPGDYFIKRDALLDTIDKALEEMDTL